MAQISAPTFMYSKKVDIIDFKNLKGPTKIFRIFKRCFDETHKFYF